MTAATAAGQWVPVSGDLPQAVAQSYERGRRAGKDWRGMVGSRAWAIRADSRGGATYTLGEPPFSRRKIPVAAWRFEPAAAPAPARAVRPLAPVAYAGDPANPWPPFSDGWFQTEPDEATRAQLGPQMLGALPSYHYHDELTPTGLYRLFAYETGAGHRAIGALRFWGTGGGSTLGSLGDVPTDKAAFDAQIASGDSALTAGNYTAAVAAYQTAGQAGAVTLGPEIDLSTNGASQPLTLQAWGINGTLATIPADQTTTQTDAQTAQGLATQMQALYNQAIATPANPTPATPGGGTQTPLLAAAIAMNNLLAAHGYKQGDQPLYRAFQSAAGLTPDGFPGAGTMAALQNALSPAGITLAAVKIYPWASGGAYDGVNAPTLAEWQGAGGGASPNPPPLPGPSPSPSPSPSPAPTPKPAVSTASMSTGSTVALVAVAALAIGGVAWAAATGNVPSFLHKHL